MCAVQLLYYLMIFRHRDLLQTMRRLEIRIEMESHRIQLRRQSFAVHGTLAFGASRGRRRSLTTEASAISKELEEKLGLLEVELPSTLRKLTTGYELRAYWWEVRASPPQY